MRFDLVTMNDFHVILNPEDMEYHRAGHQVAGDYDFIRYAEFEITTYETDAIRPIPYTGKFRVSVDGGDFVADVDTLDAARALCDMLPASE